MLELYDNLDKMHNKISKGLNEINKNRIATLDKKQLVAWMRDLLLELEIHIQALAENKLHQKLIE